MIAVDTNVLVRLLTEDDPDDKSARFRAQSDDAARPVHLYVLSAACNPA